MHAGLDLLKTTSKKVNHKATEATDEFIGNKIADKIVKTKPVNNEYSRNVKEIIIQPDKTRRIIKRIKTSTTKIEHKNKISKLLNDSAVSKFVAKNWIEVNDLTSGEYSATKNIR